MSLLVNRPFMQRVVGSGISIITLFFVITYSYTPGLWYFVPILAATVISLAMREFYEIAKNKEFHPNQAVALGMAWIYLFSVFLAAFYPNLCTFPLLALAFSALFVFISYFKNGNNPFANIGITLFGLLYLAIPLGCTVQINYFFPEHNLQDGRWWLFYLLAVTYTTDTVALISGKLFGTRLLAPYISPKKTWEGAVGGSVAAMVVSLVFHFFANREQNPIPMTLGLWQSIFLGCGLSILAQLGDLAESLLKRDVGVKHSSNIPGLGGVLDIVDSLIFTSPTLFLYLKLAFH